MAPEAAATTDSGAEFPFPVHETHGIARWAGHRLLLDSAHQPWRDVYTSIAVEQSWSATLPASRHPCLAYCRHRGARIQRRIDGQPGTDRIDLRPRQFGSVPVDRPSHWTLHGQPEIQLVYLRRELVDRVATEAWGVDARTLHFEAPLGFVDPVAEQIALELAQLAAAPGPEPQPAHAAPLAANRADRERADTRHADALYADALARTLALRWLRHHVRAPRRRDVDPPCPAAVHPPGDAGGGARMRHVRELIEAALNENLSLARLAEAAGLAEHSFALAFKRATGCSPHQYVLERRIARAQALLRAGVLPLAEVAAHTGFSSQSHLCAAFKRATGSTPGDYRRAA